MSDRVDDVSHYCRDRRPISLGGMPDTPVLDIDELTVRYGDTLAVDDLSLTIPAGQTVALLGANGAGKSTTVNAVLGLIPTTSGSVRVLGRRPLQAVRAGGVGAMLQHGGLPSEAQVGEVIDLVRRSYPTAWALDDLVATAGIGGLLERPIEALSGGQRQRVLLAVALAGVPHPRYETLPGVTAVSVQGGTVVLATTEAEATLRDLLAGGRMLPDLEVRGVSLEDAVLSLTHPPAATAPAAPEPTGALR